VIYGEELGAGGISTKTIPPQGLNLTLKGGNGKIDCTFTGITSEWLYLGQYYRLIAKPGSAPTSPMDGVQVKDVQVGAIGDAVISASITGLTNGVQYYVRLYVRGDNGWQTSVDAVGTATPVAGIEIGTLTVSDIISIKLDGLPWRFISVNKGKPSTMYSDTFNNATIFMIEDIYDLTQMVESSGTMGVYYPNTIAAQRLSGEILGKFSESAQNTIKTVKIPYISRTANSAATTASGENGAEVKLFLPAVRELSAYSTAWVTEDGARFEYFEADTAVQKIASYNGSHTDYYLRTSTKSSRSYYDSTYIHVGSSGSFNYSSGGANQKGLRFCLVLPDDALVYPQNPDGTYNFIE
jgi:hypothetical protein